MENYNLLSLTNQKKNQAQIGVYTVKSTDNSNNVPNNSISTNSNTSIGTYTVGNNNEDVACLNGKLVNAFCVLSDEAINDLLDTTIPEITEANSQTTKISTGYKSYDPTEVAKIKSIIYALHHKSSPEPTPSDGGGDDPTPPPSPSDETYGEGEGTGSSFITEKYNNFYNAETMFDYLSTLTGGEITKSTGITRAQLVKLTQNEVAETENSGFFGALNRIFYNTTHFNTDNNSVLSFEEIDRLFQTLGYANELGENPTSFLNKVNQYAAEIQTQYKSLSPQKRLEFVIEKTREYLEAAGLTKQLAALDRMLSETDTQSGGSVKVGQIALADLNPGLVVPSDGSSFSMTNGSYTYNYYSPEKLYQDDNHPKKSGNLYYDVGVFASDTDEQGADLGITLDIRKIDESYDTNYNTKVGISEWYEMVDVLVHELTHATSHLYVKLDSDGDTIYSSNNFAMFKESELSDLHNRGIISDSDWNYYQTYKNTANAPGDSQYKSVVSRLMYAVSCMSGEYAAYQADADYLDSIAGDVFNKSGNNFGNNKFDNAVYGASEKDAIINHIWTYYDNNGSGNYNQDKDAYLFEAYPDDSWNDEIFTFNKRKNWVWA